MDIVGVFLMVNDSCDIGNGRVNGGNFFFGALELQNLRDFGFGSGTLLFFGRLFNRNCCEVCLGC